MDDKIEMKEVDPLSSDILLQNGSEFVAMKTNSNALLLDGDCGEAVKSKAKSDSSFPDLCSEKGRVCCSKQIRSETVACSSICEIYIKAEVEEPTLVSDFSSENNKEFLPEDTVVKDNSNVMNNKIVIKVDPWWVETETSHDSNIKNEDLPPEKSPRLCMNAVTSPSSEKSPLSSAEDSRNNSSFSNGRDHPEYESKGDDITDRTTLKKHFHSEQSDKCSNGTETHSRSIYLKQKNLIPKSKKPHQCKMCDKSFNFVSDLKRHNLFHEGKMPHQCKMCDKSFNFLSDLKRHNLFHEGNKPYQCKTCNKSFTLLSTLKTHNLFHVSKKPYQCKICNKSFAQLSDLKRHNLFHEGKKPHQCKICYKSFTQVSDLKTHELIHEGKKPYQCKICGKNFTRLSSLKSHNLIHEGKKPHQCETCDKSFTDLSNLKRHYLIHEAKKPHHCKICDKYFNRSSNLKRHSLTHQSDTVL